MTVPDPVELLRELLRFDTTNPPGNEEACVAHVEALLTDGRFLSRAGIQTYGFLPLDLDPAFDFVPLIHAADERVPVDAVRFGADAVWRAIERYPG